MTIKKNNKYHSLCAIKNNKLEPYYIIEKKIIISKHIKCPYNSFVANIILDFLEDELIIIYDKGGISRSLKLVKIDYHTYLYLKNITESLLGFNVSDRGKDYLYSVDEIKIIGSYLNNIILSHLKLDSLNKINYHINYEEFQLCEYSKDSIFKIIDIETLNDQNFKQYNYVKYDSICGLDILLILMNKLYGVLCVKISLNKRNFLKDMGVKEIFI